MQRYQCLFENIITISLGRA